MGRHKIPLETRFCECECGGTFICAITSPKRFLKGHYSKSTRGETLEERLGVEKAKESKRKQSEFRKGKSWEEYQKNSEKVIERREKFSEKHESGELIVWDKGLTKETDERVKTIGQNVSKAKKGKRYENVIKSQKEYYLTHKQWNYGLTKEDSRVRKYSEGHGARIAKAISEGKYPKLFTVPHQILKKALTESGIFSIKEYFFGYYSLDEALPEKKVAIFADGDYWHANPIFQKDKPLDKIQKNCLASVKRCESYLRNRGWRILRFWECDIKKDVNKCVEQVKLCLQQ